MHLQVALRQAGLKRDHDGLCLLLAPAMCQPVVGIPTPWKFRVCPCHPQIERIVQKQIGQYGADHAALRRAAGPFDLRAVSMRIGAFSASTPCSLYTATPWESARSLLPNGVNRILPLLCSKLASWTLHRAAT